LSLQAQKNFLKNFLGRVKIQDFFIANIDEINIYKILAKIEKTAIVCLHPPWASVYDGS